MHDWPNIFIIWDPLSLGIKYTLQNTHRLNIYIVNNLEKNAISFSYSSFFNFSIEISYFIHYNYYLSSSVVYRLSFRAFDQISTWMRLAFCFNYSFVRNKICMGHGHQIYIYCVQMNLKNVLLNACCDRNRGHRTHRHPLNPESVLSNFFEKIQLFSMKQTKKPRRGRRTRGKRIKRRGKKAF